MRSMTRLLSILLGSVVAFWNLAASVVDDMMSWLVELVPEADDVAERIERAVTGGERDA